MRKILFIIAFLMIAANTAWSQTWTPGTQPQPAPLRSSYPPLNADDHMTDKRDVTPCPVGQILKSATILTNPPYTSATEWECADDDAGGGGGGGLTQAEVDARIAPYGRIAPTGEIADAQIPAAIARDTELPLNTRLLAAAGQADGRVATWQSGVPTWQDPVGDGRVESGTFAGTTLTLERNNGLSDVVVTGISGGGTPAAQVESLFDNFDDAASTLTLAAGEPNWTPTRSLTVDLGKPLAAADDEHDLVVDIQGDLSIAGGQPVLQTRRARWFVSAKDFRNTAENTFTTGTMVADGWAVSAPRIDDNGNNDLDESHSRMMLMTRGRLADGNDTLRITWIGTPESDLTEMTDIRIRADLVPRTGSSGPIGLTGAAGADGTPGTPGADGIQGIQGPIGPMGLQGDQGIPGTSDALTPAQIIAAVPGTPADEQVIKFETIGTTLKWGDDNTAGGGAADGVVTGFTVSDHTVSAARSNSLATITFDVPFEVVTPDSNGNLRAAEADDASRLAVDHGNIRVGTRTRVGPTTPTITYSDYSATGYRGTAPYASSIPNPQNGDRMFATVTHSWFVYRTDHWSSISASPGGWRGWYSNQGAAENHITASGQLTFWLGNDNVQHVDTYAAAAVTYAYSWEPEQERTALLSRILPAPDSTNIGEFPIVNAAGDSYTTTNIYQNVEALVLEPTGVFPYRQPDGTVSTITGGSLESALQITIQDEGSSVRSGANYVNFVGDGIDCSPVGAGGAMCEVQSDEVLFIEPDDIEFVGGSPNHYNFVNHSSVINGALYYFIAEGTNTAGVAIRFGTDNIAVLKAGEAGGLEALEGGEFETGELVGVLYSEIAGTMFWAGTVLGNAAQRDVGLDPNELVALVGVGEFPTSVMPEASDAAIRSATLSKRVLSANSVDALFIDDTIDAVNPANESAVVGATQQKIAEALRSYGVSDVTLTGVGNLLTINFTRPNGFLETSTFDLSLTTDLSLLEELLADLLEATGFHIGHDLALADIVDARQLYDSDNIPIQSRSSRIHHFGGSLNIFTYSTAADTSGIYYNDVRLADLPAIQSSGNYGGGVRLSNPSDDVYMWIDGDIINIRRIAETTVYTANWRTLLAAQSSDYIALAIDSDEESNDGRFYMMIYDTNAHVIRIGAMVMSRVGTDLTVINPGTHFDIPLIDLNDALPLNKFQQRTTGYDTGNRDGAIDISISRGALWIYMTSLVPNPEYTSGPRLSFIIGYDASFNGAQLVLARNTNLDSELLPSNSGITVEIIKHENVDVIEDAYTHTGTRNIWHYRDPNQLIVRWPNITEKPLDATTEEMEQATESAVRFMSPAGVARAIIVRGLYRGMLVTGDTFYPGDIGEAATGEYWLRTGATGTQLPADDATQWHSLNGGTLLGANQITAINDILKRIPRDVTLMAQREGPQYETAGWDRYVRYNIGTDVGIGSISEDPHSSINGLIYWRGTDRDIFQNRFVVHTNEADGAAHRNYDDKYIRFNGQSYQLEYSERTTAGDGNRYRTKEEITGVPFPEDNQASRVTWTVNFEDIEEAASETVGGPPWHFFSTAGAPVTDGGAADTGVDDVVNSLVFDLVSTNELRLTAGRTVGAPLVSNIITLPSGGGGGTTVTANPGNPTAILNTIGIGNTNFSFKWRGVHTSTTNYFIGDIVSTGSGTTLLFWIAPVDIAPGSGSPTILNHAQWQHLARDGGTYRGNVNTAFTYNMDSGDLYRVGTDVYLVVTAGDYTGTALTGGTHLIELTGGAALNIAGLPIQSSTELADVDVMVIENISDSNAKRKLTFGSLGNFLADGITITSASGVLSSVGGGGGTPLNIAGLPNLPSTEIADTDVMVTEDVSDSNAKKHFTVGELAARLADEITITSNAGTLTAVGGGGTATVRLPQSVTAGLAAAVDITPSATSALTVTAVGTGDVAEVGTGGTLRLDRGIYEITGDVTVIGNERTGAGFSVAGTGVTPLGYNNPYTRDADTAFTGSRAVTFSVAADDADVTISLINRIVSVGNITTQNVQVTAVANIYVFPVAGSGTTVVANPGGTGLTDLDTITIGSTDYAIPSGDGGGLVGIRIEEGGNQRIASADALDFNAVDFDINIVQTPEAGIAIAASIARDDEIEDWAHTAETGVTPILRGGTGASTAADARTNLGLTADGFSIHDLPEQTQQLATTDRIPLSDESAAGDPNEYLTAFNFFSAIRDVVNTNRVNPLDNDRMYVTREDNAGDPLGYITMAQIETRIDPFANREEIPVGNLLASENRMLITSQSLGHVPQFVTMQTFRDEVITHQGPWVGTRGYNLGHVVYTGSGDSLTYWIASEEMPQGTGQPTFSSPGAWYHLGHRDTYYGVLADPDQGFDFYEGSQFVWRDNLYIVTADSLGTTLSTVVAGDNVIEVTNPFRHVAELAQTPADDDEILIYDTSEDIVTKRDYSDIKDDLVAFNLHDDVTTFNGFPSRTDRMLVSDESIAGDPNEYVTMASLLDGFRDLINLEIYHNATPQDDDRLFISDEDASADPVDYITVGELRTAIGTPRQFETSLGTFTANTPAGCGGENAFVDTGVTVPTTSHMVSLWAWADYNLNSGDALHTLPYALFAALPVSAVGGNSHPGQNFSDRVAFRLPLAANRAVYFGRSFDNNVLLAFTGTLNESDGTGVCHFQAFAN